MFKLCVLTLTTTQLHPTTFLAFPSLSILHRPTHSPSFLLSSTFIMFKQECALDIQVPCTVLILKTGSIIQIIDAKFGLT